MRCDMADYIDTDINCPFFHKSTAAEITCEGITDGSASNKTFFKSGQDKKYQIDIFCKCEYRRCPIYSAIMRKYEDKK